MNLEGGLILYPFSKIIVIVSLTWSLQTTHPWVLGQIYSARHMFPSMDWIFNPTRQWSVTHYCTVGASCRSTSCFLCGCLGAEWGSHAFIASTLPIEQSPGMLSMPPSSSGKKWEEKPWKTIDPGNQGGRHRVESVCQDAFRLSSSESGLLMLSHTHGLGCHVC